MPQPANTDPVFSDSVGLTFVKCLIVLRSQYGQTEDDTTPNTNDDMGTTLKKILMVYLRA